MDMDNSADREKLRRAVLDLSRKKMRGKTAWLISFLFLARCEQGRKQPVMKEITNNRNSSATSGSNDASWPRQSKERNHNCPNVRRQG
jgi:hypothetical protein